MTNGFALHGRDHLSASQINTWIAEPAYWVATKLLGRQGSVGISAHRGKASEAGIDIGAFDPTATIDACLEAARTQFSTLTAFSTDPNKEKQRAHVDDIVTTGVDEIRKYGVPEAPPDGKHQHKVEITLDDVAIPLIGYLDYKYPQHGMIVDLKTTTRCPSTISNAHSRQGAIYHKAHGNFEMRFLYVTPKKTAALTLEEPAHHLEAVRRAALTLQRFLALSKDAEELAQLIAPDPDSFYWRGNEAIRKEIWGY